MNVYRFSKDANTFQIVVAPSVALASQHVNFEWNTIKCVYKNVTIVE